MGDITFIIPTIGRSTLNNSINCLLNQTINDWYAIIIFDGIPCNIENIDSRIKIIETNKKGLSINSAGLVRNYGISFATTKWIAFLDDDDIISNDYIETFYKELEENNNIDLDVIIFRMKLEDRIVPKIETDNFYLCDVGISFIIKKEIYDDGIKFVADGAEDFLYLDNIRQNNYKIMISPYVKYFVRATTYDQSNTIVGNRLFINIENQYINIIGYLLYYYYKEGIYD